MLISLSNDLRPRGSARRNRALALLIVLACGTPACSDGTLDRTLAIFTSDHGEEFWEYGENRGHGKSLTDPAIQVPLLVRFPEDARVAAGTGVARDVELVDIVPTVLDLTATAWTTPGDGRSLLTMPEPENRPIYSSLDFDGTQMETVRSFPWKLVWDGNLDQYRLPAPVISARAQSLCHHE